MKKGLTVFLVLSLIAVSGCVGSDENIAQDTTNNRCIEFEDMACDISFTDNFILSYSQNNSDSFHAGGNLGGVVFVGVILESDNRIIKGAIKKFTHSGGAAQNEYQEYYEDIPPDHSTIKASFTRKCIQLKDNETRKFTEGHIEYKNKSTSIKGWLGSNIISNCK